MELDFDSMECGIKLEYPSKVVPVKKSSKVIDKCKRMTSRNYCFTSFRLLEFEFYDSFYESKNDKIKYLVVGKEECPKTGKLHIQGYMSLSGGYALTTVKKWFNDNTIHIEACKGSDYSNEKYCKKDGKYKEYGILQYSGKRNDITEALNKYKTLLDFVVNEPTLYLKYRSGVEGYYRLKGTDYMIDDSKPLVIWLYGNTGTGKSRGVNDYLKLKIKEGYRVWRRPLGDKAWFDGYAGQEMVFLDEIRGSTYKFDDLLQMLDYNCPQVPIKGSFVTFKPKVILVTSNKHPKKIYSYVEDENVDQLVRRCDKIINVKEYKPDLLIN